MTTAYRFEIREFSGSSFGERWEGCGYGRNLEDFEGWVEANSPIGVEIEDEPARPFRGVVAGRQWTVEETEDTSERRFSAFMVECDDDE